MLIPDFPDLTVGMVHTLARGEVHRLYGPPGCGKTTELAVRLRKIVAEHGPEGAAVVSFTNTAACAIAAQDTGLGEHQVGTLHSLAYRAARSAGIAGVALDAKILAAWNGSIRPEWRLSASDSRRSSPSMIHEVSAVGGSGGDELLARLDLLRAGLTSVSEWPGEVKRFAAEWSDWKNSQGALDFTDMIFFALGRALEGERAPGDPRVLVGDEAQDWTPLECALMYAWGAWCDHLVLALDDDQAINAWRGGSPAPILALGTGLDGLPQVGVAVVDDLLSQSYRVPSAIQSAATQWIEHIPSERRRDKPYRPREEGGRIYHINRTLADVATARAIEREAKSGRSVMVLATCQYMLNPILSHLRALGVPFWNPYRPAEQLWNPLVVQRGMGVAERLYRYLLPHESLGDRGRLWTGDDVRAWSSLIDVKKASLLRGAKVRIGNFPSGEVPQELVEGLWACDDQGRTNPAFDRAVEPDLDWFMGASLDSKSAALRYPAAVVRNFGPGALVEPTWKEPNPGDVRVIVGTIHSVKGGEADVTFLSPSISPAAHTQWTRGGEHRDELYRQFYVGMTRSREELIVLHSTECHVPRGQLCPAELVRR